MDVVRFELLGKLQENWLVLRTQNGFETRNTGIVGKTLRNNITVNTRDPHKGGLPVGRVLKSPAVMLPLRAGSHAKCSKKFASGLTCLRGSMNVPDQEPFCRQNFDALDSHAVFPLEVLQRSHRDATEPHAHKAISSRRETPNNQQLCTQRQTHCDSR